MRSQCGGQSPPLTSRTFASSQTETLGQRDGNSPRPSPSSRQQPLSCFLSLWLCVLCDFLPLGSHEMCPFVSGFLNLSVFQVRPPGRCHVVRPLSGRNPIPLCGWTTLVHPFVC